MKVVEQSPNASLRVKGSRNSGGKNSLSAVHLISSRPGNWHNRTASRTPSASKRSIREELFRERTPVRTTSPHGTRFPRNKIEIPRRLRDCRRTLMKNCLPKILATALLCALAVTNTSTALAAEQTGPGRRFLAADDSTRRLAIVAPDGSYEWELKIGGIHDAQVLPNGNVLLQMGFQRIVEVDRDKKTVWEYDSGKMNGNAGQRVEVHAFQRVENGLTMIAESGPGRIIEVDKDGKIQREIKLKRNRPNAHSDTRLARKIASGNYLVAHEADGFVREYAPDGAVVWEFEVPLFDKPKKGGHGPEAWGNSVFSAMRLANGNTLIGTGNGHSVLEVTPKKEIVWKVEQNDLPGITLAWVTCVERLPNGNTMIGNCHAGPANPQIIEVTADKKVVWTFKDFKNFGNSMPVQSLLSGVAK